MAEEYGTPATNPDDGSPKPPSYGDPPTRPGALMGPIKSEEEQEKVAKAAQRIWSARDKGMEPLLCQWKLNVARRKGITNGKLIYDTSEDEYTTWFPEDASPDSSPDANKAASLCRKFPSIMFADPPAPSIEPPSGDNEDEDAAEFSTRALQDLQGEARLNTPKKARTAFDRANDHGSGFVFYYIDEKGGGRIAIEVLAHAQAQTLQDALINPQTGMEQGPYITRFVTQDGRLTDDEAEAATKYAPDMKSEVVTGRNVRPIPHTASDINEAHAVQIGVFETLGKLRRRFPDVFAKYEQPEEEPEEEPAASSNQVRGQPDPTVSGQRGVESRKGLDAAEPEETATKRDLETFEKKLLTFEPEHSDMIRPPGEKENKNDKEDRDNQLVWVLTTVFEQCPDYEDGLYLITLADCYVAYRGPWSYRDKGKREKLILPIAQFPQFDEGRDSFYKVGAMEILGGANEVRSAQLAAQLDWLDKLNNQKIFLPIHSVLDPKQLQFGRATVLYMNPGGEPQYQNLPPYPRESVEMRDTMTTEMNDMIGLQETGQGMEAASVNSGKQAMTVLSQVHAAMSEPRQNIETGYLRCCRIELQLARAFLTTPQRWHIVGDDSGYKETSWRTADLITTSDVRLKPGTLSMLSPAAKAQFTEYLFLNLQLIGADEAKEMIASNLGGVLGLQEDPFRMRIRRQIASWSKGPPKGWVEQRQQQGMMAQQQAQQMGPQLMPPGMPPPPPPGPPPVVQQQPPPIDPMTGLPAGPPPPPIIVDPVLAQVWDARLCDTMPNIAALRTAEIAKLMSSTKYERWPPDWRAGVDAEFQRMQMAQQPMMAPPPQNTQGQPRGEPGAPGQSGKPAPTPGEKGANMFQDAGVKLPTEAAGVAG